jgi:phage shock protein A
MVRFTTAVLLALTASSQAFVSPSFVAPRHQLPATYSQQTNIMKSTSSRSSSATALQMNLFDRFVRVAKSNVDSVLKNLEDPEKIMSQALEDMQNDLVKIRQSYAEVTATQRRLMKQKEQCDSMAEDWYQRAQLALQKGNEELAREALSRRQAQTDEANGIQQQIDAQAASIDKLYEGMQMLETKILESKAKKEQMVARARTAQSTQKVNDMLGGVTGKTSMDAFTRMEEKVEALEAQAEVSAEMGSIGGNMLPGSAGSSLENEFKALESASEVDDELKKLKGLLGGSSSASSSSSSSSSAPSDPKVDDELAKLKKDAGL